MQLRKCPVTTERFWACEKYPRCLHFEKTMLDADEMEVQEDQAYRKQRSRGKAKSKAPSSSRAHSARSCPSPRRGTKQKAAPKDEDDMSWEKAEE